MQLRSRRMRAHDAEVSTDALNDILFILVMFFLIVSTLANPNVIKVTQPKSKADTKAKQSVVVSIDANKQYYVGSDKVTIDQLKAALIPVLAKENGEPTIVINSDKTVPIDYAVAVMRIARELNARTVLSVDNK
ncbi:ExbD/TolR family protein [Dinghuibacter silviterrae]|nr:biopolymer transporter ExbD [Dinghuibacter silviterrae]